MQSPATSSEQAKGSPEMENRCQHFVWVKPWKGSVGHALDAHLLQTNSVFAMTAFSLITTLWAIVEVKISIVESFHIFVDILTLLTAFISLKVCFTGSIVLAATIVAIMIVRLSLHIATCYLCFYHANGYVLFNSHHYFQVPNYPWYHIAMHILDTLMSLLTLAYYACYFSTLHAAEEEEEVRDGLREASIFRKNRVALGKGHYHWLTDVINMNEYGLYEDYEKGTLSSTT